MQFLLILPGVAHRGRPSRGAL